MDEKKVNTRRNVALTAEQVQILDIIRQELSKHMGMHISLTQTVAHVINAYNLGEKK
jgi:hypothetical protein